jgi:hypothetical protein
MQKIKFLDEIPINVDHTLYQLLGRFQAVRDGIPELLKNAKDQYARLGITEKAKRVIVIAVNTVSRSVAVIDFAGATKSDFERWQTWSDPAANLAEKAHDIEGGHGNGGKAFMVRGSVSDSFLESCTKRKRTKMGFENDLPDKRFFPGYFLDGGKAISDVPVADVAAQLRSSLRELGIKYERLPAAARDVFERRKSFTVAQVNGVKDWDRRREETLKREVADLPKAIVAHPQSALTIETCSVFMVVDGKCINDTPLSAEYPEPFPGFETPLRIPIPDELTDPRTKEAVGTGVGSEASKFLELRTSRRSLRMEDTRPLNVIRVRNDRNIVDNWSVADLHSRAESAFIFGALRLPDLKGDHLVGADRMGLADTALVRAIRHWTSEQVKTLADKIQAATAKEHKAEDRDVANQGLKKLRELMQKYLQGAVSNNGLGPGTKGTNGPGPTPPPPPPIEYGERVDELVFEGGGPSIAFATGTGIPILVKAYEVDATGIRKPVRKYNYTFHTESKIVEIASDGRLLGQKPGVAKAWLVEAETGVKSNEVSIEVIACSGAEIQGIPERLLLQGERLNLRMVFNTATGQRSDLLVEASVDEPNAGRINRYGTFTAGGQEGLVTVRLRYGPEAEQTVAQQMRVGPDRISRGKGGTEGGDVPEILLCGTPAPHMEQYPPEQRTVQPAEHLPTIIDYEPQFEHVVFVNPDSKEAIQVRRGRGGRKGVAGIGTETFLGFLALKTFEILKRLYVRQALKDGAATEQQFRAMFAEAEMECAPFVEQAYHIARELTGGENGGA